MATGAIIAAAAAKEFNDFVLAFRLADATGPERARPLTEIGITSSRLLSRLESAGVVKPGADPASFYLDERALNVYRSQTKSRAAMLIAIGLGVCLAAFGMIMFLSARR